MGKKRKKTPAETTTPGDGEGENDSGGALGVRATTTTKKQTNTVGVVATHSPPTTTKKRAKRPAKRKPVSKQNTEDAEDGEVEPSDAERANASELESKSREFVGDKWLASRQPSPPPNVPEQELENEEVRNILRQPRYFDDDYEAAALRCFRCGQGGHREVECELPAKKKACHLCGFKSHIARDCPHGLCFNCLTPGHQSRDCPYVRGSGRDAQKLCCLRCGKSGHIVTDCVYRFDSGDLAQISCYVCGSKGHLCCAPQDALPPGLPSCCRCGGEGHLDSSCAHARRGFGGNASASAPEFACFHCGERGHIARECPSKSRGGNGGGHVDFSNAPKAFAMGSAGSWRGGHGASAHASAAASAATGRPNQAGSRGYAAKYGQHNRNNFSGSGGYRPPHQRPGGGGGGGGGGSSDARWIGGGNNAAQQRRWN